MSFNSFSGPWNPKKFQRVETFTKIDLGFWSFLAAKRASSTLLIYSSVCVKVTASQEFSSIFISFASLHKNWTLDKFSHLFLAVFIWNSLGSTPIALPEDPMLLEISSMRWPPPQPISIIVWPYWISNSFKIACLRRIPILVSVRICWIAPILSSNCKLKSFLKIKKIN